MAHVQAAYFTERDIAEKQRDSFYNPADPWDNGDISFTGGIQPLMVNALTDEGPSGIDYRERGPMWRWSRPERKAKLSISINHHHTEPAQNADVGCMPGLLLPAVPALPWWLSTVARMWKTRMALPWRAFPTQRAPPSGLTLGQAPFLVIPQSGRTITLRQGGAVAVNWSSNRRQKNEGTAPKYAGFRPPHPMWRYCIRISLAEE